VMTIEQLEIPNTFDSSQILETETLRGPLKQPSRPLR
jgi:hypothetical protein